MSWLNIALSWSLLVDVIWLGLIIFLLIWCAGSSETFFRFWSSSQWHHSCFWKLLTAQRQEVAAVIGHEATPLEGTSWSVWADQGKCLGKSSYLCSAPHAGPPQWFIPDIEEALVQDGPINIQLIGADCSSSQLGSEHRNQRPVKASTQSSYRGVQSSSSWTEQWLQPDSLSSAGLQQVCCQEHRTCSFMFYMLTILQPPLHPTLSLF